ncbi:DUF2489 domain-containing protein [Pseudomonas sp. MAP12]|uniref:DUF2489 domain-containing protein n=1 Tax=Geopseudomonas aromaticivorans TaxID=2849492 RepID=A0ABS6N0S8_9GAMM|nr:DUF2489 domain-containing protein [Pseudomonas aromaticivorans]MBV2134641.1 DUF2489 domain-containing protein [Pseudomonas aromaticivorans]
MNALSIGLLLAGLLVVLVLGGYALHLWRRVWAQQKAYASAESARQQRLGGDLRLLAGSLLDEQLPLIEGAIRIKILLDNYNIQLSNHERCRVFHTLFDETSGIPTHAAWKALTAAERRQHDKRFSELELQHKAAARKAARWLLDEGLPQHPAHV